jgi:hypothetical protein
MERERYLAAKERFKELERELNKARAEKRAAFHAWLNSAVFVDEERSIDRDGNVIEE